MLIYGAAVFGLLFPQRFQSDAERLDKRLGDITYALNLVHPLLIAIASYLALQPRLGGGAAHMFVPGASLLVAVLIVRGMERPATKLRNGFRGVRLYD